MHEVHTEGEGEGEGNRSSTHGQEHVLENGPENQFF